MFNRYRERGLALIPLKRNEKFPIMKEWEQFSERLPTESESDLWEQLWADGHRSVGLVLGPASGVVAVDLDHPDDPELNSLCPFSPVIKRGQKGETRFFRPCDNLKSMHVNGLDILWTGTQTVMPPSIHPKTKKPYEWITPDTLEYFDIEDLPILDLSFVEKYVKTFEKKYPHLCKHNKDGHSTGRNNWLKDVVWAKRSDGESEEDIIDAVYSYDFHRNNPRLFTDASEGFSALNEEEARMNVWKFVANITRSFIEKKGGLPPSKKLPEILVGEELKKDNKAKKFIAKSFPEPKGLLGKIYQAAISMNRREAKTLSLGGSIAIGATIISNIFKFKDTWPNIYILNVAPTGAGKGAVQDLAKELLVKESGGQNLLGYGNYSSSIAMIKDLNGRRERLDVIDEATSLFSKITNGGSFQRDIDDVLCVLYSSAHTLYVGPESANKEAIRVWNPCVSALMSTTVYGLKNSVSNALASKGLFPRCLPFIEYDYSPQKKKTIDPQEIMDIGRMLRDVRMMKRPDKKIDIINSASDPIDIPCSNGAQELLDETIFEWNAKNELDSTSEIERMFLTRAAEQSIKLALIHGALRLGKIEELDVRWAIDVVNTVRYNASHVFPQLAAENRSHANLERVYAIISERGAITHRDLLNRTRFLNKRERNEILESLVEEGIVHKTSADKGIVWSNLK